MRWGVVLLLLLAGCVAGHDVVIVMDFSQAGSLVITRPGPPGAPDETVIVRPAPPKPNTR